MSTYKPVTLDPGCMADNRFRYDGQVWLVSNLIERAKGLEPFDLPLCAINIGSKVWTPVESPLGLAKHMKRVQETSLEHPIILDDEGFIMDGWHRVAKALLEGLPTIKAVRFDKTPACDFVEGD